MTDRLLLIVLTGALIQKGIDVLFVELLRLKGQVSLIRRRENGLWRQLLSLVKRDS